MLKALCPSCVRVKTFWAGLRVFLNNFRVFSQSMYTQRVCVSLLTFFSLRGAKFAYVRVGLGVKRASFLHDPKNLISILQYSQWTEYLTLKYTSRRLVVFFYVIIRFFFMWKIIFCYYKNQFKSSRLPFLCFATFDTKSKPYSKTLYHVKAGSVFLKLRGWGKNILTLSH